MTPRQFVRRIVPYEVRLRIRLVRRSWHDRRAHVVFATSRGIDADYPHEIATYHRDFVDYVRFRNNHPFLVMVGIEITEAASPQRPN